MGDPSYTLSSEEQTLVDQILEQHPEHKARLEEVLTERHQRIQAARSEIRGLFCYVEGATGTLHLQDLPEGQQRAVIPLHDAEPGTRSGEIWSETALLVHYEDGKQARQLNLLGEAQGLLMADGFNYHYPFSVSEQYIGLSNSYHSPYQATAEWDAYDLLASPQQNYLFVTQRWAGRLSVIDLNHHSLHSQYQIREAGHTQALNLSWDEHKHKLYLTDNLSSRLTVIDLQTQQQESFELPWGTLGNLALGFERNCIYLELLDDAPRLVYLELDSLQTLKELDVSGASQILVKGLPCDLMQLTPDRELLLFATLADAEHLPHIHVIKTRETRVIRQYKLKEGGTYRDIAVQHPSRYFVEAADLTAYLAQEQLLPEQIHPIDQSSLTAKVPAITLFANSEEEIVRICVARVAAEHNINLEHYPLKKRLLRQQAVDAREALEKELTAEIDVNLPDGSPLHLSLSRQGVLQQLAQRHVESNDTQSLLFLPGECCPICGAAENPAPCSQCNFNLLQATPLDELPDFEDNPHAVAMGLLRRVSILEGASEEVLQDLAEQLKPVNVDDGDILLEEGQLGSALYFVLEGQLQVKRAGLRNVIALLSEGDVVGEMGLVSSEPRSATVQAKGQVQVLRLEREDFLRAIQRNPQFTLQLRRLALERRQLAQKYILKQQRKSLNRVRARMAAKKIRWLSLFKDADPALIEALADQVKPVSFEPQELICRQGEPAHSLYLLQQGQVKVSSEGQEIAELSEGALFGEMAFFLQQARAADVIAESYCRCLEWSYQDLQVILFDFPEIDRQLKLMVAERHTEMLEAVERSDESPELRVFSKAEAPLPPFYLSLKHNKLFHVGAEGLEFALHRESGLALYQAQMYSLHDEQVFIADTLNDRVLLVDLEAQQRVKHWDHYQYGLIQPLAAYANDDHEILITDSGNQRLLIIKDGKICWEYAAPREIVAPRQACFTPQGSILLVDSELHQVLEIERESQEIVWSYGQQLLAGGAPGFLASPHCALRLDNGLTVIADTGNHRILWVNHEAEVVQRVRKLDIKSLHQPVQLMALENDHLAVFCRDPERILVLNAAGERAWSGTLE